MGNRREYLINNIVRICQRLDQKGFGANHDGNVTARFGEHLLATPTAISKGTVTRDMIITLDMNGKKIGGIGRPFSEIDLHLAAYRGRPEVMAVVHAHPPFATARGLGGAAIKPALPEAIVSIGGDIPVIRFAIPGSPETGNAIRDALQEADALMMQGNGVLSVGDDVEQAYLRLELVEHLAKIDFYANQIGRPFTMPEADIRKLLEKRASIGLGPRWRAQKEPPPKDEQSSTNNRLQEIIREEIKRARQGN